MMDIDAAYQEMLANHPGVCDPANPAFLDALRAARENGLELASKVRNAASYRAAIQAFGAQLHDGHAGAFVRLDRTYFPEVKWPGFMTVWRGDSLKVYASQYSDIPVGATVLSCDGTEIRALILANVYGFHGQEAAPGDWWVRARTVLFDFGNPFIQVPQSCSLEWNGRIWDQPLHWTSIDDDFEAWSRESYNGNCKPAGIDETSPGIIWISLPTFQPDDTVSEIFHNVFASISGGRERILAANAIVIDLRQNQGGSSYWAHQLAIALWGKEQVESRLQAQDARMEVWWRASKDNTDHVTGLIDQLRSQKLCDMVRWAEKIATGMQAAVQAGQAFYVEESDAPAVPESISQDDASASSSTLAVPVYVIVPGQCASACLDALDRFTLFPNTRLIGAPSSTDSTYMDIRTKILPSGMAAVIIPNKVYVNRPRSSGQFYSPDIVNLDLDWSSDKFQEMIEADLRTRSEA